MKKQAAHIRVTLLLGLLALGASHSSAGAGAAFLNVNITLNTANPNPPLPPEPDKRPIFCVSQTLSEQTQALVRVMCETGQFVSITPLPNKRFLGTHGGAFRYNFAPGDFSTQFAQAQPYTGAGTVTGLRIYNANGADGPLELLVSF